MSQCPFNKGGHVFDQEDTSPTPSLTHSHPPSTSTTPASKLDTVWQKVLQHRVTQSGDEWPAMTSLLSEDYSAIYENKIDVQEAKVKVLCSRGAIAKVRIEWFNHGKYTGLFKQAEHGLIRLTSAFLGNESLPSWLGSVSSSKIFPCCALKFFRGNGTNDDNTHSGNFLFGGKKTGQTEEDFFAHPVCTHLTEKINFVLSWILAFFRQYTSYPTQLGVSDFAAVKEDGTVEDEIVFPWCLALVPTPPPADSVFRVSAGAKKDEKCVAPENEIPFIAQILRIPSNTTIYDIYSIPSPKCLTEKMENLPNNAAIERIGRIVTDSEFVQSTYDQQIFFKHQRKEEDYAYCPDWLDDLTSVHANTGSSFFESHIKSGKFVDFERIGQK